MFSILTMHAQRQQPLLCMLRPPGSVRWEKKAGKASTLIFSSKLIQYKYMYIQQCKNFKEQKNKEGHIRKKMDLSFGEKKSGKGSTTIILDFTPHLLICTPTKKLFRNMKKFKVFLQRGESCTSIRFNLSRLDLSFTYTFKVTSSHF